MVEVKEKIKQGLIVSCQALPEEPLHSSFIMGRMAIAAVSSGAIGIRANTAEDIQEIQKNVAVPIIGIKKKVYDDCPVFITPTLKEMREIADTGVEIVACDATLRPRPDGKALAEVVSQFKKEYPHTLLMADCATVAEIQNACQLDFDFVGTTLHGYTAETEGMNVADNDFAFLKEVLKVTTKPVIAEGKVDTPAKAKRVLELGCHAVVVGGAITRPQEITKRFVDEINN